MFTPEEVEKIEKADKEMKFIYVENDKSAHLNFKIPRKWMNALDNLVSSGVFFSRSEAVRNMIKDYFDRYGFCPTCGGIVANTE